MGCGDRILQPYLDAVATCQNPAALRAVVGKVLQEPELFAGYNQIKDTLLHATAGRNKASGSINTSSPVLDEKLLHMLDLFSYGTVSDYHAQQIVAGENCLLLNEPQLLKLRQLTVLSLIENACKQHCDRVPYAAIFQALCQDQSCDENKVSSLQNWTTSITGSEQQQTRQREVEQLLAQLLAAGAVTGKLCQKSGSLVLKAPPAGTKSAGLGVLIRPRDVPFSNTDPSFSIVTPTSLLESVQQMRSKLVQASQHISKQNASIIENLENERAAIQYAESKVKSNNTTSSLNTIVRPEQSNVASLDGNSRDRLPMSLDSSGRGQRQKRNRGGFTNSSNDNVTDTTNSSDVPVHDVEVEE